MSFNKPPILRLVLDCFNYGKIKNFEIVSFEFVHNNVGSDQPHLISYVRQLKTKQGGCLSLGDVYGIKYTHPPDLLGLRDNVWSMLNSSTVFQLFAHSYLPRTKVIDEICVSTIFYSEVFTVK